MRISNFTMLPDIIVQEQSIYHAMVYGIVWRYCQMDANACFAPVERIAREAGCSYRKALDCLKDLCNLGYIEDKTPARRNRPHFYIVTGEIQFAESSKNVPVNDVPIPW